MKLKGNIMNIKEKVNTILLCDIAKHLGIDSEIDPDIIKYAITSGNEWIINAEYSFLLDDESSNHTKEDRDFLVEILNMYRGLSASLRKFSKDKQQELIKKNNLKLIEDNIQLPGFDGNNEYKYTNILEGFWKINRFTEQKAPISNTHSQTIDNYRRMINCYKSLNVQNRMFDITESEFQKILDSAPHGF